MALALADIRLFYEVDSGLLGPSFTVYYEQTQAAGYTGAAAQELPSLGFESLRKVTLVWRTLFGTTPQDDERLAGIHLLAVDDDGTPLTWDAARFAACESAIDAFWAALLPHYRNATRLTALRWHRAGPRYDAPKTPGPKVREVARSVDGSNTTTGHKQLPSQLACAVTERTMMRKRWGRFYLPAPASTVLEDHGRLGATYIDAIATAAQTMYGAFLSAGCVPVVYSPAAPARSSKRGHTLPAKPPTALKVNTLQIDDVADVIRSRRFKQVNIRARRGLAVV